MSNKKRSSTSVKKRRSTYSAAPSGGAASNSKIKVCNIELGHPTVQYAQNRILDEIAAAKSGKWRCVKFIHGYGSSGKGGLIKNSLPSVLDAQMRKGNIRDYIRGEDFSMFDTLTQRAMLKYPELSADEDLGRRNHGITIVLL